MGPDTAEMGVPSYGTREEGLPAHAQEVLGGDGLGDLLEVVAQVLAPTVVDRCVGDLAQGRCELEGVVRRVVHGTLVGLSQGIGVGLVQQVVEGLPFKALVEAVVGRAAQLYGPVAACRDGVGVDRAARTEQCAAQADVHRYPGVLVHRAQYIGHAAAPSRDGVPVVGQCRAPVLRLVGMREQAFGQPDRGVVVGPQVRRFGKCPDVGQETQVSPTRTGPVRWAFRGSARTPCPRYCSWG